MTDDDIHKAVVRWVKARTLLPVVIKGEQGGDLPALPYGMVNLTGTAEVRAHPQEIEYEDQGGVLGVLAFPIIETEWRFSIHSYGPNPTDKLRPLRSAYHLAQANEPLMPGMVIHSMSQIRDVPDYVNEAWEPRGQVDLFLRGLTRDGVLINTIEEHAFDIGRMVD